MKNLILKRPKPLSNINELTKPPAGPQIILINHNSTKTLPPKLMPIIRTILIGTFSEIPLTQQVSLQPRLTEKDLADCYTDTTSEAGLQTTIESNAIIWLTVFLWAIATISLKLLRTLGCEYGTNDRLLSLKSIELSQKSLSWSINHIMSQRN